MDCRQFSSPLFSIFFFFFKCFKFAHRSYLQWLHCKNTEARQVSGSWVGNKPRAFLDWKYDQTVRQHSNLCKIHGAAYSETEQKVWPCSDSTYVKISQHFPKEAKNNDYFNRFVGRHRNSMLLRDVMGISYLNWDVISRTGPFQQNYSTTSSFKTKIKKLFCPFSTFDVKNKTTILSNLMESGSEGRQNCMK